MGCRTEQTRSGNTSQTTRTTAHPLSPHSLKEPIGSVIVVPMTSPKSCACEITESSHSKIYCSDNKPPVPQEMTWGSDLIKVWNIDDESEDTEDTERNFFRGSSRTSGFDQSMDISLWDEAAAIFHKAPTTEPNTMPRIESMTIHDDDHEEDCFLLPRQQLPFYVPPMTTQSPFSIPEPTTTAPFVLPPPRTSFLGSRGGSAKTIVLDSGIQDAMVFSGEEATKFSAAKPARRGHRRSHRRNNSHFDFDFR